MNANCKYCRKQASVAIPGNYLCSRCKAAGIRSPRMSRRSWTSARRAVSLPVTDSTQAPPDGSEMSMMGCTSIEGANSAKKFWEDHPDMHKVYHFGGWSCQIGNKKAPDRGHA
jgi:hypothetical protein